MNYLKQYRKEAGLNTKPVEHKLEPKSPTPTKQTMMYLNNQQGFSRQRRSTSGLYGTQAFANTTNPNLSSVFKTPVRQSLNKSGHLGLTQTAHPQHTKLTTPKAKQGSARSKKALGGHQSEHV